MYRNIVFHLNRQPPNYKIGHQPVLSAVHTTATKRRFCSTTKTNVCMAFGCIMEFGNIGTGFSLSVDNNGG